MEETKEIEKKMNILLHTRLKQQLQSSNDIILKYAIEFQQNPGLWKLNLIYFMLLLLMLIVV